MRNLFLKFVRMLVFDRNGYHMVFKREGPLEFFDRALPMGKLRKIWLDEPLVLKHMSLFSRMMNHQIMKLPAIINFIGGTKALMISCAISLILGVLLTICTCTCCCQQKSEGKIKQA